MISMMLNGSKPGEKIIILYMRVFTFVYLRDELTLCKYVHYDYTFFFLPYHWPKV